MRKALGGLWYFTKALLFAMLVTACTLGPIVLGLYLLGLYS